MITRTSLIHAILCLSSLSLMAAVSAEAQSQSDQRQITIQQLFNQNITALANSLGPSSNAASGAPIGSDSLSRPVSPQSSRPLILAPQVPAMRPPITAPGPLQITTATTNRPVTTNTSPSNSQGAAFGVPYGRSLSMIQQRVHSNHKIAEARSLAGEGKGKGPASSSGPVDEQVDAWSVDW